MRTVSAFSVQFKVAKIYNELTREKVTLYERKAWIVGAARGMTYIIFLGVSFSTCLHFSSVFICMCVCVLYTYARMYICDLIFILKLVINTDIYTLTYFYIHMLQVYPSSSLMVSLLYYFIMLVYC